VALIGNKCDLENERVSYISSCYCPLLPLLSGNIHRKRSSISR
jgi:hypothetical protein